jgi:hypothetical protein
MLGQVDSSHSGVVSVRTIMASLTLYAIFFLLVAVIGWRLRQRKGRIGAAAVGSVYEMLNDEKRNAIEIIVEEKAAERDPEHADDMERPRH